MEHDSLDSQVSGNRSGKWRFWIDRGGTFTDVVARLPDGSLTVAKFLSHNPQHYQDAAVYAIENIMGVSGGTLLAGARTGPELLEIRMGTTLATNALLERKGAAVLLVTTKGLGDQLWIGYQTRPELFALAIKRPLPLYHQVLEVEERLSAEGEVLRVLDRVQARNGLQQAFECGLRSCAIVLMHGYRHPQHEVELEQLAREVGFTHISVSHQVSAQLNFVLRGQTTLANAYLSPPLSDYLSCFTESLGIGNGRSLWFMHSGGGLVEDQQLQGKDAVLSGPAAGVVGAIHTAVQAGCSKIITFDMGGTSSDVAHYAGHLEYTNQTVVAGVCLGVPALSVESVAAGGGSVCWFDGHRLRLGPHSAGAYPGPVCYRQGGKSLTITDCNLVLGKLPHDFLPAGSGPNGRKPNGQGDNKLGLDRAGVIELLQRLSRQILAATGTNYDPYQLARGFVQVAVEHMASAIKRISVGRGHDLSGYTLVGFGGAGGQHVCQLAELLGLERILVPHRAGVLSALGLGMARVKVICQRALEATLDEPTWKMVLQAFQELEAQASQSLAAQGVDCVDHIRQLQMRYTGVDNTLLIPFQATAEQLRTTFEQAHLQHFGFAVDEQELIINSLLLEAGGNIADDFLGVPEITLLSTTKSSRAAPSHSQQDSSSSASVAAGQHWPCYWQDALTPGLQITGPAILQEETATNVIEAGWAGVITEHGHLLLERRLSLRHSDSGSVGGLGEADLSTASLPMVNLPTASPPAVQVAFGDACSPDPTLLEVFANRFMAIAEQMGSVLENSAYSVNIKERLDFSCAIFSPQGDLIANAPHIPVHLGSMAESVRTVIKRRENTIKDGQVYMTNHPYRGGTHLPDITVITPVFDGGRIGFFLGSRAHHADIGGLTPGSMPAHSSTLDEEGVVIDDFLLVQDGHLLAEQAGQLLTSGRYPVRNLKQNLADLTAQIAANSKGLHELGHLAEQFTWPVVEAYVQHLQDNAAKQVSKVLSTLAGGKFEQRMDNGSVVKVQITTDPSAARAVIDFTGTSAQTLDNFNAPAAITQACVLYVLRTLIADQIPLNQGCLEPIELIIPPGTLLNPHPPAAVAAGNVETSQVVANVLYGALGCLAGGQGTMNNLTFGDAQYQYYETIGGGAGAGAGFDGASCVHTHMTNSRLTDPEVLERRFPVLVEQFARRADSGGKGRWQGGDGIVRRLRFRSPVTLSIVSNNRVNLPFGLRGGQAGRAGSNRLEDPAGRKICLASTESCLVEAGWSVIIETPGGGGYGLAG